jgi:hypothetical protein
MSGEERVRIQSRDKFLPSILSDLTKFKFPAEKSRQPRLKLICGNGYNHEKVAQTVTSGWAADQAGTSQPNEHIYAKTALNLVEKMAISKPSGSGLPQNMKRIWSQPPLWRWRRWKKWQRRRKGPDVQQESAVAGNAEGHAETAWRQWQPETAASSVDPANYNGSGGDGRRGGQ